MRFIACFLILTIIQQSCMPYKSYERDRRSNCIYLDMHSLEIKKTCSDGNYQNVVYLEVEVWYDTVKIINGKPSSSFILYKIDHMVNFPYKLDPAVLENKNSDISISMRTNMRDLEYSLRVNKTDWVKDSLIFTYYYLR